MLSFHLFYFYPSYFPMAQSFFSPPCLGGHFLPPCKIQYRPLLRVPSVPCQVTCDGLRCEVWRCVQHSRGGLGAPGSRRRPSPWPWAHRCCSPARTQSCTHNQIPVPYQFTKYIIELFVKKVISKKFVTPTTGITGISYLKNKHSENNKPAKILI